MENNKNDTNAIKNKWHDILRTPTGRTQTEVHTEINDQYREHQKQEDLLHRAKLDQIRKSKLAYRNKFNIEKGKDQNYKIPVDGDIKAGSRIFMMQCASCHSLELFYQTKNQDLETFITRSTGPSLATIYLAPAASQNANQYNNYTTGLLQSGIVWNSYNLFNWLKNPQSMVKDTKCMSNKVYVESVQDRADLLKFIKSFSKVALDYQRQTASKQEGYDLRNYREQAFSKLRDRVNSDRK